MFPQARPTKNWQDFGLLLCSSLWHLPGLIVVSKDNTNLGTMDAKKQARVLPTKRDYLSAHATLESPRKETGMPVAES